MSIIIGLDISLNSSGWCKIDTENGARTFATFDHSALKDMERISTASRDLADLCRPVDLVVMEGLSMGLPARGGMAFMPQGRIDTIGLTYIVRLWLWKTRKPTLILPPTSLKKFASGKGNIKKNLMLRAVSTRWNVMPEDDNAADAIALAEFGRAYLDPDNPSLELPDFQRECLPKAGKLFDF